MMPARILLLAVLSLPAVAQEPIKKAPPDPYTAGDPVALDKAGYLSLGPFAFGNGHDSAGVEGLLGSEPLIWIETPHFRIGCSLSTVPLKGEEPWTDDWISSVRKELKRLSTRIPAIKVDTKTLDPWLRAHLMAQRAEDVYAEVMQILDVTDASFPAAPGDDPLAAQQFRGLGPFLGMPAKFRLLLVKQAASHARYTRAHQGREMSDPIRHHDPVEGSIYWGASEETAGGLFRVDLAMHAHMVFNIAHNLYNGYRSWGHELPAWLPTGLAHWHARRISPRFPAYDRRDEKDKDPRSAFWEWDKRVPGLMKNAVFEPLDAFLDRENAGLFSLEQHMQAWSLADFLLAEKKDRMSRFLHLIKEPFHGRRRMPTPTEMRARQRDAISSAFETDVAGLDREWRSYIARAGKPKKPKGRM